jgi:conjugal transfer ATP-binding protein TraC
MRKLCSTDGDKFVFVTTTAFLFGQNAEVTQDAATTVKSSLDKLGLDARIVRTDGLVRWSQALPLNFSVSVAENLKSEAIMGSSAAGTLLPVYGDYQGNARRDTHYGVPFIARRGSVYTFDPYQTSGNFNGTAVAPPGKGKSFILQYIVYFALAEGTNVFLIDNGRSSKKFCLAVGGEFNDFNTQNAPSLNPFTGLVNEEFDQQFEGITSLIMLMAFGNERPQAGATIALSEAVRAAWAQQQGDAEITHVIDALDSINRNAVGKQEISEVEQASLNLVPRLRAFMSSPTRGIYFKGPGSIDIKKQFTVFEMAGLAGDEHLRKCVTFFILNMLMNRIKNIKGRKMIVIDEAHDLFKDDLVARAMEGIYLKGRKDGVSIWTIVQSLLKLAEHEAGRVIINSSAWKLLLEQEPSEISELFKSDILPKGDPYFERLVRSVETRKGGFSEVLISNSRAYEVVRLYVDQFSGTLFSSEGEARDEVFDLMEQGIPPVDAVKRVMNAKGEAVKDLLSMVVEQIQHEHPNISKFDLLKSFKEAIN